MEEQLKEIKERYMYWEYDFNLNKEDINWLIEQAEKSERYEKALNAIINPQITEWFKYNEERGGQISFQEFLKDIARNNLNAI
jgi:hypothetical protein